MTRPIVLIFAILTGCCPCPSAVRHPDRALSRGVDVSRLVEVKTPRTGLRPKRSEHGKPLVIENEWVHGIGDADCLQVKPTLDDGKCYSWTEFTLRNVELGSAWRTQAGAGQGYHVDRLQVLGNAAATIPTNVIIDSVRFTTRGDAMPDGATTADVCLLQEAWLGAVVFRDVWVERGLSPIKMTFRTPQSRVESLWIERSPGLRIVITALKPEQIGRITVRSSPGYKIDANVPIRVVEETDPLDAELISLKSEVNAAQAKAEKAEVDAARANEKLAELGDVLKR